MKPLIKIETDKRIVTEGEVIEVRWECPGASQASLNIYNGFKSTTLTIEPRGSKRFRVYRSKHGARFTLSAQIEGRTFRHATAVKVLRKDGLLNRILRMFR